MSNVITLPIHLTCVARDKRNLLNIKQIRQARRKSAKHPNKSVKNQMGSPQRMEFVKKVAFRPKAGVGVLLCKSITVAEGTSYVDPSFRLGLYGDNI